MKNKLLAALAATMGAWILSGALYAHHSDTTYDSEHPITLKGTVTEFAFVNPHTQIRFEVKGAEGNVEKWTVVSASPRRLRRVGWNAKTLKPGDEITVTGTPARDGSKTMSNRRLVTLNGKVLHKGAE